MLKIAVRNYYEHNAANPGTKKTYLRSEETPNLKKFSSLCIKSSYPTTKIVLLCPTSFGATTAIITRSKLQQQQQPCRIKGNNKEILKIQ